MKKETLVLLLALLIALPSPALAAKNLRFAWDYDAVEAAHIDGFRLYQNGEAIQDALPTARTIETPYIESRDSYIYYLTAFQGEEESGPSDMITIPPYIREVKRIATGSFTVEIIEVE